jgi:hypothetical protein
VKRWLPFAVLLAVSAPALVTPFCLDDWVQRAVLSGAFTHTSPWALFTFADGIPAHFAPFIAKGPFPWFTLPELKIAFFRPLSTFFLHVDVWAFGDSALGAHLHSIAWALAMLAAARRLYGALVPQAALIASVMFALDDSHAMSIMWVANRNALHAGAFGLWGLIAHLAWREQGRARYLVAAMACFTLALASAEASVGLLAYVVARELAVKERRFTAVLPTGALVVAYAVVYRLLGMGAWGSATYLDPTREPLAYLGEAPRRFLALFGTWSTGVSADGWLTFPHLRWAMVSLGVVALPGWWWVWRKSAFEPKTNETLRWLSLGALLAVLPTLATWPTDRLLLPASFGACAVAGSVLQAAWVTKRRLVVGWASVAFLVLPLVTWGLLPTVFRAWDRGVTRTMTEGERGFEHERVVVLSSTDFAPAMYGTAVAALKGYALPTTWHVLSMSPSAVTVTRTDATHFELALAEGRMIDSIFEENFRATRFPFATGDTVPLEGLRVTVQRVEGGHPISISVQLERPLTDFTFVWFDGERFARVSLPDSGHVLELPRAPMIAEVAMGAKSPGRLTAITR